MSNLFNLEAEVAKIETRIKIALYREIAATLTIRAEELETLAKGKTTKKE